MRIVLHSGGGADIASAEMQRLERPKAIGADGRFFEPEAGYRLLFQTSQGQRYWMEAFKTNGAWEAGTVRHDAKERTRECAFCGQWSFAENKCPELQKNASALFFGIVRHPVMRIRAALWMRPLDEKRRP